MLDRSLALCCLIIFLTNLLIGIQMHHDTRSERDANIYMSENMRTRPVNGYLISFKPTTPKSLIQRIIDWFLR